MAGGPLYEHKFIYLCPSQDWRILKLKEQAVYNQQDIFEPWTVGFFCWQIHRYIPLFIPNEMTKHINPAAHRVLGCINESRVNYNGNHSCLICEWEALSVAASDIDLTCFSEQLCEAAPVFITTVTTIVTYLQCLPPWLVTQSTRELNWSEVLASQNRTNSTLL